MADTTSLHLRLPKRLYKRLQQQARRNNVSLNTEIINQLEGRMISVSPERMFEVLKSRFRDTLKETVKEMVESGEIRVGTEQK